MKNEKPTVKPNQPKSRQKPMKKEEERFRLSPKGILWTCLMDAFKDLQDIALDDHRFELLWELFESRMKRHGYVEDEPIDESQPSKQPSA